MRSVYLFLFLFVTSLFMLGCSDRSLVNIYDPSITKKPIGCMKLAVTPANQRISSTISKLYTFDPDCSLALEVSSKNGIHCNSNQNAAQKNLSNFPKAYLRMELREGMRLKYSYYIDLDEDVREEDVQDGFARMEKDLQF